MKKYIAILRGINVSGKNKLPMKELRELLSNMGYQNVQTYIQSGNVILESEKESKVISVEIHEGIQYQFGYDVPVILRTQDEWRKTIEKNPYPTDQEKIVYFTFLDRTPENTDIEVNGVKEDEFTIIDDVVYIYCLGGYGKSKLSNNLFEKKLKVTATTRNLRTTMKLLELANQ